MFYCLQKEMTTTQVIKIEDSPAFINFIESLSDSKDTRKTYLKGLRKYMKFLNVDDSKTLLLWDSKVIEQKIINFIVSSRSSGASQRSIRVYYAVIRHFYKINDIVLNWDKLKMFVGKSSGKKANDRPYTHEEIHKLLEHATPRERVLVLLMCSAGLRVGGVSSLNVGHLQEKIIENSGQKIYQLTVYKDTDDEYTTFCTPECAAAIDTYLQYRRTRLGETITNDSSLLVNLIPKERSRKEKKKGTGVIKGDRVTQRGSIELIYRLLKDSGLRLPENRKKINGQRHATACCHSLRKFFRSQLKFAKVDHLDAETLLGHSTGLVGVYTKIPEEELLQSYTKAIGRLTINEEERLRCKNNDLIAEKERIQTQQQREIEHMKENYITKEQFETGIERIIFRMFKDTLYDLGDKRREKVPTLFKDENSDELKAVREQMLSALFKGEMLPKVKKILLDAAKTEINYENTDKTFKLKL
jgi:site-specific recombinase XerD